VSQTDLVIIWPAAPGRDSLPQVELRVSSRSQGDRTVMSVSGEIDLYTAPRLHGELVTALAGGGPVRLVVDMSGVEFCDSTGMNVLLAAHRRAREHGGDLELARPRPAIMKILQVTGLETVFTVVDDPATVTGP
jgi:anti-sigma B factor antagonist